ncbi:pyridoxamine 5'-phosphate oxidase family protein [Streptomyces sp. NBC_00091]|uniref:pyridoxamine 5'-phosphate oxidase family protein n=1 Tax=Streptomyces sp. NBC_00091 TaxID=2975648 RepID=UPI0022531ED5|nr:pyridoxamine 5'-phosphate oxidase family protein [Streptomyces sp. NBC_00091]MCX5381456.1 pyridoxamine 5'-phosphate oxidase family protein [Streptomyces sp. NBC_00091]
MEPTLNERVDRLLANARFTTLATHDGRTPWAATVNFVALHRPLRLLWASMASARHSRDIAAERSVAGSIYMTGLPGFGLDGMQYSGTARSIEHESEVIAFHKTFYDLNFPDEAVRQQLLLPPETYFRDGGRRLYLLTVEQYWLLDIDRWLIDMTDQRIEVPAEIQPDRKG